MPSSYQSGNGLYFRDKDTQTVAYTHGFLDQNGSQGIRILGWRRVNGTAYYNGLSLGIRSDGTAYVGLSSSSGLDPASTWRSVLGAVNKAGDTMTGNLIILKSTPAETLRASDVNSQIGQSVPTSDNQRIGAYYVNDNQNYNCSYSEIIKTTADDLYRSYVLRRKNASGTVITNGFYLHISNTGAKTLTFDSTTTRNAWRSALGGSAVPTNFTITNVAITVGQLSPNGGTIYNQSTASGIDTNTYRILQIVGWELSGLHYTDCSIPKLAMSGANILWSVTNHGSSTITSLTLTVHILKVNV